MPFFRIFDVTTINQAGCIRFERNQYIEVREAWTGNKGELAGKSASNVYGAEHLCRLLGLLDLESSASCVLTFIVTLPELIAQTNMDHQSVNRLREELTKLTSWIGRNATKYFVKEYETPSPEYIEKAKGV
jgi:mortality factor 4-like protein 1